MFMFYTPGVFRGFKIGAMARNELTLILKVSCRGVLEPCQISMMRFFEKRVNSFHWLSIFAKKMHHRWGKVFICS